MATARRAGRGEEECGEQGCDEQGCGEQGCDEQGCDEQGCGEQGCSEKGCDEQGCEHYRRGCRLRVGEPGTLLTVTGAGADPCPDPSLPRAIPAPILAVPRSIPAPLRALILAVPLRCQAPCCGKLYPCRLCHDAAEEHQLDRFRVSEVQCIRCRLLQKAQQRCEGCDSLFGEYYCDICHLFDRDKKQYHCEDCGICRGYRCPLCMHSALDMTRYWRQLDNEVAQTPMPTEYQNMMVEILCNDCNARSTVQFHLLGMKCKNCESYNTAQDGRCRLPLEEQ
ncbi:hypothetical protein WISP_63708 [Willisornis vidua]|uniref:ZN363 protein n=1 Tax=Willisornis vidua TaxID=1566151 RepID=A0ABQ9DEB0_9PASS|nr:hypothetical protein WISP_63708 [Willisornis vidua]